MIDLAIATWRGQPQLDSDEALLGEALDARDVKWRAVPWDDGAFEWSTAKLVVVRSTWDYSRRRAEFLAWAEAVSLKSRLHNPLDVLRRNTEKSYLLDLEAKGVAIVPTLLHEPCLFEKLDDVLGAHGWEEAVVKPAVSAGGWRTHRVRRGERSHSHVRAERVLRTMRTLVQPFLPSVLGRGERALVYLDGRLSHGIRKRSIFETGGELRELVEPAPDEVELAEKALSAAGARDVLYARVDVVRDGDDRPVLIELELTEPRLFLAAAGRDAAERLAEAIVRRL